MDRNLAIHEAGHVIADALFGADIIVVRTGDDENGLYAETNAYMFDQNGLSYMQPTVKSLTAGAAFTLVHDNRFECIEMRDLLQHPVEFFVHVASAGIAAEDLADVSNLKTTHAEVAAAMRCWLLVARWINPDTLDYLAALIMERTATGNAALFQGGGIRDTLGQTPHQLWTLAEAPGLFAEDDNVDRLVTGLADFDQSLIPTTHEEQAALEQPASWSN